MICQSVVKDGQLVVLDFNKLTVYTTLILNKEDLYETNLKCAADWMQVTQDKVKLKRKHM